MYNPYTYGRKVKFICGSNFFLSFKKFSKKNSKYFINYKNLYSVTSLLYIFDFKILSKLNIQNDFFIRLLNIFCPSIYSIPASLADFLNFQ